ncbi:MAG TPA: tail fiber domain-containing protein [Phycisphaerales bacterium]
MHRFASFVLSAALACDFAGGVSPATAQIALPASFTYQGFVADNGTPVNSSADMSFSLWSDPISTLAASRLGNPQDIQGVAIDHGRFTVELNASGQFSANAFTGDARWLEVSINGVPQLPRTMILATPYAQRALTSNSLRLPFSASMSTASGHALRITNDSASGNGVIMGAAGSPISTNSSPFEPTGVRGDSFFGTGVLGVSAGPSSSGVAGINDAPSGVGALGSAKGPTGIGVVGEAGSAFGIGVRGRTTGVGGAGVLALSSDANTFALIAQNTGNGVTFLSKGESIFAGDVSLGSSSFSAAAGKLILRNKNTDSIILRPDALTANEFVQITFADPDGGTPTVGLRYTDFGPPGRIDVIGGRLRGVLENTSTVRAKHEVTTVGSALSDLLKLRPVEFTWNAEYGGGRDVGLIAEEVAAIFPSVTSARDGQVDSIRYSGVTALLVRGMQEQQEQLESQRREAAALRDQNAHLEERLRRLEAALERALGAETK